MSLLDRYIARQFLVNVCVLTAILFAFVVAVDVSINLDRFNRTATKLAEAGSENGNGESEGPGGLRRVAVVTIIIADLWWPRLLQLFNFLIGTIMLGAMGFTCAQLMRHRELLAMLAAGVSLHRVARPILVVAGGLSLLQLANTELVIPRIAPLLIRDHGAAGHRTLADVPVPLTPDGQGRLFRAARFDGDAGILEQLFVLERDERGVAVRVIRAESAQWDGTGWILERGESESRRRLDGSGAPQVQPIDRIDTALDPDRITMRRHAAYEQALGFTQIGSMLSRPGLLEPEVRDRLNRLRFARFAVILSNVLALVIALPFFVSRNPTGILGRTLACLPVAGTALIGGVLGSSAAIPGVPGAVSVFVPPLILLPAALAALTAVKS